MIPASMEWISPRSRSDWPRPTTPACSTSAGPTWFRPWIPEDVQLSEVSYLNATFHFIRVESERH